LLVEEGVTNLYAPACQDPASVTSFGTRQNVVAASGVPGWNGGLYFGDNSVTRYAYSTQFTFASATTYTLSCTVLMDDGSQPVPGAGTTSGDFSIVMGAVVQAYTVTPLSGGGYRVTGTFTTATPPTNNNCGIVKYANSQSAKGFKVSGFQLEQRAYATSFDPGTRAAEALSLPSYGSASSDGARRNLLTTNQANGCEDGTTAGFSSYQSGSTISSSTDWAYSGTHSLKVVTDGLIANQGFYMPIISGITAGRTYVARMIVYGASGTVKLFLDERDAGNSSIISTKSSPVITLNGSPQIIDVVAPFSTGVTATLRIVTMATQALTFYVDQVSFYEVENAALMPFTAASPNMVSLANQQFAGWTALNGETISITQGQALADYTLNGATRILGTGNGSTAAKYSLVLASTSLSGRSYTSRVIIKNQGAAAVIVTDNLGGSSTIAVGATVNVVLTSAGDGVTGLILRFNAASAGDILDILAYQPAVFLQKLGDGWVPGGMYRYLDPVQGSVTIRLNVSDNSKEASTVRKILSALTPTGTTGITLSHLGSSSTNWLLSTANDAQAATSAPIADNLTPNGWTVFTLSWQASQAKAYVNGTLRATINNPNLATAIASVGILCQASAGSQQLNTSVDLVRFDRIPYRDDEVAIMAANPEAPTQYTTLLRSWGGNQSRRKGLGF
jgi:hypothetical protein